MLKKILLIAALSLVSVGASAHWTGWAHCHGDYFLMWDIWGVPYHQHDTWFHY